MCGLYVEVIEDSIDAMGEFLQRSSYQHSLFLSPSCASSRFLCLRLLVVAGFIIVLTGLLGVWFKLLVGGLEIRVG